MQAILLKWRSSFKMKNRKKISSIILTGLLCIVTLALMELTFTLILNNSWLLNGRLLGVFRNYYMDEDRKIIQYLSDCGKYDDELAYTLKPGKCHIKNREFEVDYLINSIGMRDDESSLISPEIIVAGDSHAMGWGVKQDLIFSSLLEKKLGKRILNAAISSYGTVREMKILDRVNLDNLKYLIIQYCGNDFNENNTFAKNGNILPIMSEESYNSIKNLVKEKQKYFFGKYSFNFIKILVREAINKMTSSTNRPNIINNVEKAAEVEVDLFLNAIMNSSINLNNVVIIVFEINSFAGNDSLFIDKLNERLISEQTTCPMVKNIKAIDLSLILGSDKYFHLDDHMNSMGHHAISETLAKLISGMPKE